MENTEMNRKGLLFRIVIPAFKEINIFSRIAKITTGLGPIMVATVADELCGWRVEVIDENNYRRGPRDKEGLPDHKVLQDENPAAVVGLFCGLSSTMERVWQLAEFYRQQGTITVAGGWHVRYQPEESLKKGIDVVAYGDGESIIQQLLGMIERKESISGVPGISFLKEGQVKNVPPAGLEALDLNNLPFPNFGLLRYAELKVYPIGRIRGCSRHCEFCSVRGKPNWATGQHLFETVKWLVESRGARRFFIVDDRLEEDRNGTLDFFALVSEEYGRRLKFNVQIRLEAAKDTVLLDAMKKAGVRTVCIGYESCLNEELIGMKKGYLSSDMIKWTKVFHDFGFFIHGMFIFGYPLREVITVISAKERMESLKRFIRQCRVDTVQVFRPVPLAGTELRSRIEREGKLFPLEIVPWSKYDGNYICYQPDNMTLQELQELPIKIMRWFYSSLNLATIPLKTLIFPLDYLIRGWQCWYRDWRNDITKYGGHLLFKRWIRHYKHQSFLKKLEKFSLKPKNTNSIH